MRKCLECSGDFLPRVTTQKYCGDVCRVRRKNRQVGEWRKTGMLRKRPPPAGMRCSKCGGKREPERTGHHTCRACGVRNRSVTPYLKAVRLDPCSYCGGPGGELDHIKPRTRGGDDNWSNRTAACKSCNSAKLDSDLLGFLLYERILDEIAPGMRELLDLGRAAGGNPRILRRTVERVEARRATPAHL